MPSTIRLSLLAVALTGSGALMASIAQAQGARNAPPVTVVANVPHVPRGLTISSNTARSLSFSDKTVKLWDLATGRLLRNLLGHSSNVSSAAFSPDGVRAISADDSGTAIVWDLITGRPIHTSQQHPGNYAKVVFMPDGKHVLSTGGEVAKLWEASSGRVIRTISDSKPGSESIALSSDGALLLTLGSGVVKLWDVAAGKLLRQFPYQGDASRVDAIALSRDGRRVLTGSRGGDVKLWDANTGGLLKTFEGYKNPLYGSHAAEIRALSFSPDGRHILAGTKDAWKVLEPQEAKTLKVWDIESGKLLRTLGNETESISFAAYSPDGGRIVYDAGGRIKVHDLERNKLLLTIEDKLSFVSSLGVTTDGQLLVGTGQGLNAWDLKTGKVLSRTPMEVHTVSSDGSKVASWNEKKDLELRDVTTGAHVSTFERAYRYQVRRLAFSAKGDRAAGTTYATNHELKVWDTRTGRLVRNIDVAQEGIALSSDGTRVLALSRLYETIQVLDVATGRPMHTFRLPNVKEPNFNLIAFVAGGYNVLAASMQQQASTGLFKYDLHLLDGANGRLLRSFVGHSNLVNSLAFSPDGTRMVSASNDKTMKLWDLASGRAIRTFVSQSEVLEVAFSHDGTRLISSDRTTTRIWNVGTGELLADLMSAKDGEWLILTPEGFFSASDRGAELLSVVRGFDVWSIDQFYQSLYRPDLVREKLAGDTRGLVREAAAKLDLNKVLASGNAPIVSITSPRDGARATAEQVTAEVEIAARGGGIGRVEWRINGVTVGIETPPAPPAGQPLRLTRGLVLDDGENEVEVVAYNGANLVASVPARAQVTGQTASARTPARLFVLAVGLNEYAEAKFKLTYAVPDAKALVKALSDAGKGVYENVDVTLVQDADVKRGKLDAMFADLAKKVRPSDVFVFFLGGHGKTIDGRYYFIPQDFRIDGGVTKAALDAAVVKQGIAQEEWQTWLARIPARKSVLLFDTCESGSLTGEGQETRALERTAANDRLVQATGRTILTASSDDADAFEGFRGHGLFTYNVLEALERADSDGNGRIEVAELAAYVYAQVTALSEQVFKQRQVPQVRITGNYSLAKPTQIFANKEPGIVLPAKATHQVTSAAELLVQPAMGARRVRKLDAKTPVTLVKSDAGWTLIAREGRPLGFVATKDLVPIQ